MLQRAETERAGGLEPLHGGRGRGRDPALADLRAAVGELALGVVHVLVRERHAVQRALRLAGGQRAVGGLRGFQRLLGLDAREGVERRAATCSMRASSALVASSEETLRRRIAAARSFSVHLRSLIGHRRGIPALHDGEARRLGFQRDGDALGGIARRPSASRRARCAPARPRQARRAPRRRCARCVRATSSGMLHLHCAAAGHV